MLAEAACSAASPNGGSAASSAAKKRGVCCCESGSVLGVVSVVVSDHVSCSLSRILLMTMDSNPWEATGEELNTFLPQALLPAVLPSALL
eukprot:CAMPEP_0181169822 /NCGR_PEP_ID=MMETSP1096-20121128/1023_1 /TAXON_ID=156174 ORGANISM="Chrysochromulina ericina, Strain CCMP281" /NCGR_SAMPLE_ID=MMETSP1096 /ASSEMBLY_ACC=CAM_ASM_000453 /LENGTH=89 /DNA_ID=CAMNT_0023257313 /DNA_START=636 /DNA_END=905 /DNA_ORIENTATION=+